MNIPTPVPQFAEGAKVTVRERLLSGGIRVYPGLVVSDDGMRVEVRCDFCTSVHTVDQTEVEPS